MEMKKLQFDLYYRPYTLSLYIVRKFSIIIIFSNLIFEAQRYTMSHRLGLQDERRTRSSCRVSVEIERQRKAVWIGCWIQNPDQQMFFVQTSLLILSLTSFLSLSLNIRRLDDPDSSNLKALLHELNQRQQIATTNCQYLHLHMSYETNQMQSHLLPHSQSNAF